MTLTRDIFRNLRSAVFAKRPMPADVLEGEIAIGYHTDSVGLYVRDTLGKIRKIGPAHIGVTPPVPTGYTSLSDGELWIDLSATSPVVKFYDEASDTWVASSGLFDAPFPTNKIPVGNESGISDAYLLDPGSFFVDHTAGSLEVRLADNIDFGSYRFVSETGTGLRTSVFRTVIGSGDNGWVELEAYDKSLYRSGKYLAEIVTSTGAIHVTELLLCHNGTNTFYTEYGAVGSTVNPLGEFQAVIVNVAGTDLVSLQFRRTTGVTGTVTVRTSQVSLF